MPEISMRSLLLNLGHALDHFFLLIYTTAVIAMAPEFGLSYGEMLPYATGAFIAFGLGSLPAGWLGDHWSRHGMMIVFFIGIGLASLATGLARSPWQIGIALTVVGIFAAIYHPVGIAMLVQNARAVGLTLGVNGLAGNLGVALAALITGFLVDIYGWRMAFYLPGALSILLGIAFWLTVPKEDLAPAKRAPKILPLPRQLLIRVFVVLTATSICGSLIFNVTTVSMPKLFQERLDQIATTGSEIGIYVAIVFALAALAQLFSGHLIDKHPLKAVFLPVALVQVPLFYLAATADNLPLLVLATAAMFLVFGQIPFGDAMVAKFFDDRWRSRVYALRLTVSFSVSAIAIPIVGIVHATGGGFTLLLQLLAVVGMFTVLAVLFLPNERQAIAAAAPAE
ncbi:MFS transporter [Desertibaculum subflavum]|uniref:MFS transporter n=1 Tax=Desertibaculum subflavum TaxID=2268458 RepID=UPI000E66D4FA